MFDNFYKIKEQYLQQRSLPNNTQVSIQFLADFDSMGQVEILLEGLETGDAVTNDIYLDMFCDNENENNNDNEKGVIAKIDEQKTGKSLLSLQLNIQLIKLSSLEMQKLIKFTDFCPNLTSLDINLDLNNIVRPTDYYDLWKQFTNLKQLKELKFSVKYNVFTEKCVLEMAKQLSNIINLQSLQLVLVGIKVKHWDGFYEHLSQCKKLNQLFLDASYHYNCCEGKKKLAALRNYKKLLRLVSKDIKIDFNSINKEEENDYYFDLFG